ncbi:hypothetical protein CBL_06258 [Carabus blaptoides fortunei]
MALNKEIDFCEKISSDVKNAFLQVYNAFKTRETQLLRQIEVLAQHYKLNDSYDKCLKQVTVVFDNENDILNSVANFGRIDFNGLSCDSDVFKIEDYQKPESDHVSLYKYLENSHSDHLNTSNSTKIDSNKLKQLIQESEDSNEYICAEEILSAPNTNSKNVAVLETSNSILECIEKQDASLCLHISTTGDDEPVGIREDTSVSVNETKRVVTCDNNFETTSLNSFISSASVPNLNCKCNDSVNVSGNTSKTQKDSYLTNSANNLTENANAGRVEKLANVPDRVRKLSMKQPVQVQQWMKQIISEPEIEPAPSNVMEHSHIKVIRKESV